MSEAKLASYDYKDQARIACLLCQRKFKSLDTLHRHQTESQLHRDNLANLDTCRQAVVRKIEALSEAQAGGTEQASSSTSQASEATPSYRDRASERRAVFGADTPTKSSTPSNSTKVFEAPKAISAPNATEDSPQSAPEKPLGSDNIGSKLLAMMGWTQGQGLGLKREGRTDIVQTKIYKPGAGLGSSAPTNTSSHEADQNIVSSRRAGSNVAFTGYLDRAKDRKSLFPHAHYLPVFQLIDHL
ncbi:hypothetical protein NDA16_000265 [Ustilago loliicola]|nr:hypothetical protein NDA16_000265 [Ustilago loliicola]